MDFLRIEVPLSDDLVERLSEFWQEIYKTSYAGFRGIFSGAERAFNRNVIYMAHIDKRIIGTCHLTVPQSNPIFGGLGEVATATDFRRMGIASTLCKSALDEFRSNGGQALFLGTENPDAARVYRRLGYRKLAGANVMANITTGTSPEAFLVDYFRENGSVTITAGTAADRIPVIPLLTVPHDWQMLDANAGLFSTRYVVQRSCMGLYSRYEALARSGKGAWFGAKTGKDHLVGLSTVRFDEPGSNQVDGFIHQNFIGGWKDLIETAIDWGAARGASSCWASVSVEDEDKQSLFKSLGFRDAGTRGSFSLEGRNVASVRLERTCLGNRR